MDDYYAHQYVSRYFGSRSWINRLVGLIVPNISKRLLPPNYKYLIPFTALAGAILMIISDIVARIIIKPLELPIGVVTAVIGAIVLIYIMKKGRQRL